MVVEFAFSIGIITKYIFFKKKRVDLVYMWNFEKATKKISEDHLILGWLRN